MLETQQISELSDSDLYEKLQEIGGTVGPIVASTRSIYERQLYRIMHGISLSESSQESCDEPEQRSVSDGNFANSPSDFLPTSTSSPQTDFGSKIEFRHRPLKSYAEANDGIYFDRTTLARGTYRSDLRSAPSKDTKFKFAGKCDVSSPSSQQPKKMPVTLLAIAAIITILAVLVYMNMESNPLPKLS